MLIVRDPISHLTDGRRCRQSLDGGDTGIRAILTSLRLGPPCRSVLRVIFGISFRESPRILNACKGAVDTWVVAKK